MNMTHHAAARTQQRCIPPLIDQWLDQFGEKSYDGHGGVRLYFSQSSVRTMERTYGREPIHKLLPDYRNVYKVVSTQDGRTITVGHLTKRIKRG
ncbi:hypothetical protein HMY34_07975 [Thiothrix subterranea]|uniref:hypothetical protein n=1 Tax=Thiothrix subterranea TaxID=2735563 RepID=UPI00192AC732|nr:hypothetical protein [Thiothrix subterranea]QQZ28698.1 hypothetical protein HMY34_07975 [Thiothrix subterranea]